MNLGTTLLFAAAFSAGFVTAGEVTFEPNLGQAPKPVVYIARTAGGLVYLTGTGFVLYRTGSDESVAVDLPAGGRWKEEERLPLAVEYRVGRDRSRWASGVPRYLRLWRAAEENGVGIRFHGTADGHLEYDLELSPGTDPRGVEITVRGAKLAIEQDGALTMTTPRGGVIRQRKPALWQTSRDGNRIEISGGFEIRSKGRVGFHTARLMSRLPLTIDPIVDTGTYLGGSADEKVVFAGGDGSLTGNTSSIDFPGAPGRRRGRDVFIRVQNRLLIIGGSGDDEVLCGGSGKAGGTTDSRDLPVNAERAPAGSQGSAPSQENFGGGKTDGFIVIMPAAPNSPVGVSYVGGPGEDRITAVDPAFFNAIFAGVTTSGSIGVSRMISPNRGGFDWFLLNADQSGAWTAAGLHGGSGDDIPLAVSASSLSASIVVAGVTTSRDYITGATLQGPSDGFAVRLSRPPPTLTVTQATIEYQMLVGGSGADTVNAAAFGPRDNLVLGGVTASADFPVRNAAQPSCASASTDGFVSTLSETFEIVSSTCIGGSRDDQITSINAVGPDILFGGWTESADLTVRDPFQATLAGRRDGLYGRLREGAGSPVTLSYFGGAGDDEILSVSWVFTGTGTIIGGVTRSGDLPFGSATHSMGGSDGFVALIGEDIVTAPEIAGGKGTRTGVQPLLWNPRHTAGLTVRIESADPAIALVASSQEAKGTPSLTLSLSQRISQPYFHVDCLSEGETSIKISADSYPDSEIPVRCVPPAIHILASSGAIPRNGRFEIAPSGSIGFQFYLGADDPSSSPAAPRLPIPDGPPFTLHLSSSNPTAGRLDSPVTIGPFGNARALFTAAASGETNIRIDASGVRLHPADTFSVAISPVSPPPIVLAPGLQAAWDIRVLGRAPATATFTSSNPGVVAIATQPSERGQASVSGAFGSLNTLFLQAVATSGEAEIRMESAGTTSRFPVRIGPNKGLSLNDGRPFAARTSVRNQVSMFPFAGLTSPSPQSYFVGDWFLLPERTATLRIESNNPDVIAPAEWKVEAGARIPPCEFTPRLPGHATLTLVADGLPVENSASAIQVNAVERSVQLEPVDLIKDATALVRLSPSSRFDNSGTVTVTSEDPAIATLLDSSFSPRASVTVPMQSFTALAVRVRATGGPGATRLIVAGEGYATTTAKVTVGPAGWAWPAARIDTADSTQVEIGVNALDAETLLPLGVRSLPAPPALPRVTSSNPDVAVMGTLTPRSGLPEIEVRGPGRTTLTIEQPEGFTQPATRSELAVTVLAPKLELVLAGAVVPASRSASLRILNVPRWARNREMTLTSSDPALLLFSRGTGPGQASIKVPGSTESVTVQALDNPGTVRVTLAVEGFEPTGTTINVAKLD